MTPETAQTVLTEHFAPWVMALDPTVTEIGVDRTTLTIPITDQIIRTGGIVSGQTMTALADTAMVLACMGHLKTLLAIGTQFLRPATGTSIRAEAEVTRAGRTMIFARCTLIAEPSGKPVAMATATFAR